MPENPSPPRPTPQPPVPPPEPLPPNPSPAPLVGETVAVALWATQHIGHNQPDASHREAATELPPRWKQKAQRRFDSCCPGCFAVIAVVGFHILNVLARFPAFLDQSLT